MLYGYNETDITVQSNCYNRLIICPERMENQMLDRVKFMEMLQAITEVAKVQDNRLTKEEIADYFSEMELEDAHFQHIYQYLGENGITVPGFLYKKIEVQEEPEEAEQNENKSAKENEEEKQSPVLSMYMEELSYLETMSEQEKTPLFLGVRNGEEEAKNRLFEGYLPVVVELANKYKGKGMLVEDLIQEGNLGLLEALGKVGEISNIEDADTFIIESIRQAMVEVVDEEIGENDWEETVLAKPGLISEAAKYLAEDMGRVATVKELAKFTKLSEEEIKDILQLSLDAVKVGTEDGK